MNKNYIDILHGLHCADYLKRRFSYSAAQVWNNLAIELSQATSLTESGTKLSRHGFRSFFSSRPPWKEVYFGGIFIVTVVRKIAS